MGLLWKNKKGHDALYFVNEGVVAVSRGSG
jgi:hypothetical protein